MNGVWELKDEGMITKWLGMEPNDGIIGAKWWRVCEPDVGIMEFDVRIKKKNLLD